MSQKKTAIVTVIAALGFLILTVAMAFGAVADDDVREDVTVMTTSTIEDIVLDIGDLADGESRTFERDGKTVVVTRHGEALDVTVEGEGEASKHLLVRGAGDAKRTIRISTSDHGAGEHVPLVWVATTDDGDEVKVTRRVEVRKNDDGTVEVTVNGEPVDPDQLKELDEVDGLQQIVVDVDSDAHVLGLGEHAWTTFDKDTGRISFHCENDGTDVSVPKDKVGSGVVSCPICGTPMEKVERSHVKIFQIRTDPPAKTETH